MNEKIRIIAGHVILFFITLNPPLAYAASNVVPDGSTETTIDQAPNGVTIVNIATPNDDGTSNNRFSDFNSAIEGLSINNSNEIGISQLVGAGYANPHLVGGSEADLIIAQVTSNRSSELLGYIEIFGQTAQFVLANPNGISCNGCGFLNTSRLTLATGNVVLDVSGNLNRIDVSDYGNLVVGNLGLDASRTDYFDIITRTAQITGSVWGGGEVAIKAGRGQYDIASGQFLSSQTNDDGLEFAIDASALGSIYAGKISLISTEEGLGVRNRADLVADTSNVEITADGRIVYNNISATNDINITSSSDVFSQENSQAIAGNDYNIAANNFENNGEVFAGRDINQNLIGDLENAGALLAGHDIDVTANAINNSGLIFANSNITLDAINDINNSGDIGYLLDDEGNLINPTENITIHSSAGNFTNQELANILVYNLSINVDDVDNSGNLIALNDLTLGSEENKIGNLNNSGTIQAYHSLLAYLVGDLTNSGSLYADNDLTIDANSITNNGLIFANSTINLTTTNNIINNGDIGYLLDGEGNLMNPAATINLTSNSGGVFNNSAAKILGYDINIKTSNLENDGNFIALEDLNIGDVAHRLNSLTNSGYFGALGDINIYANAINNASGEIVSDSKVYLDTNRNSYTHQGTINADAIEIVVGDFTNSGLIESTSRTDIDIAGNYNHTSGENIKSDGLLKFVVSGSFNNNSNLISGSVEIDASNITNNDLILANSISGYLELISKSGNVTNNNKLESKNDLIIDSANNITNSSRIVAMDNLFLKANNDINNNGLIYANNSAVFDFTNLYNNSSANILALNGDLSFGKNYNIDAGIFSDLANLLNNHRANIQAGRDIFIKANSINNLSDTSVSDHDNGVVPAQYQRSDWNTKNWQVENYNFRSTIKAGRDLDIEAIKVTNDISTISAGRDIYISGSVENKSTSLAVLYDRTISVYVGTTCDKGDCTNHYENRYETDSANFDGSKAVLAAGNNLFINGSKVSNIGSNEAVGINQNNITTYHSNPISSGIDTSDYLNLPSLSGVTNVDNGSSLGAENYPIRSSSTPNITYLVESDPELIDVSKFISSNYFLQRIGFDSNDTMKLVGDSFVENQIIQEAILRATGRMFLDAETQSAEEQMTKLYDNAATEYENLHLSVGVELSTTQVAALRSDIIWLVQKEVNGQQVMVPVLYLSKLTKDSLQNNGGVISGRNVQIAAQDFTNQSGTISAVNNSILDIVGDVNFTGNSKVIAGNSYIFGDNLTLRNDNLNFTGNSLINLTGDLNLLTKTKTQTTAYSSKTTNYGSNLTVAGDFDLTTGGDVNIAGSSVSIGGDGNITTGGDFNLTSVADSSYEKRFYNKSGFFSSKSSTSENWSVKQKESNVTSDGNLTIDSGKDVNVIASTLDVKENLNILAKDEVNFLSLADYNRTDTHSSKSSWFSNSVSASSNVNINQVVSDAMAQGNLTSYSGGDTNIVASNLVSANNTTIVAGKYLDENGDVQVNADANLNIQNAMDSSYSYNYSKKTGMDLGAVLVGAASGGVMGLYIGAKAEKGDIHVKETYDETTIASNIGGNNISLSSGGDINLISSNLTADNNVEILAGKMRDDTTGEIVTVNQDANLLIGSAEERHDSYEKHEKIRPSYLGVALASAAAGGSAAFGGPVGMAIGAGIAAKSTAITQNYDTTETRLNKVLQSSSNVTADNDLNAISANNITISASNINVGNDATLAAGNEVSIISALEQTRSSYSHESQEFGGLTAGLNRGRASAGVTYDQQKETINETNLNNKSSNVSAGNDLTVVAQNDVNLIASNLTAGNDVNLASTEGNINIKTALDTKTKDTTKEETEATLSVGVGNAYVDAAYAVNDNVKAAEALKDAKDELENMKSLQSQGKASKEAVEDAEINLAMATANFALATAQTAKAAANAAGAASTSYGTGFYADLRLDASTMEQKTSEQSATNIASNILAGNDINLNAALDINQIGSHLNSTSGDINYTALGDINIGATKDTYGYQFNQDSKNISLVLLSSNYASMALSNVSGSIGFNKSDQAIKSSTYQNSTATADGGAININSGNDANIIGANLTAKNIDMDIGGNLNIASLQNESHSKGSGFGMNLGGGSGSASFGINSSSNRSDRLWVDDQTSIVGSESVNIDVANNTNIKGALIANIDEQGVDNGNLNLETASLTYSDIKDTDSSRSRGAGIQLSGLGMGSSASNNPNDNSTGQQQNQYPIGSTTLSMQNQGYEKEGITRATIGNGNIVVADSSDISDLNRDIDKSQEITKDTITGALNFQTTIDNRLLTAGGRAQMSDELANLPTNLQIAAYGATNTISNAVESVAESGKYEDASVADIFKSKQQEQVIALNRGADETTRKTINNLSEGQSPEAIQAALDTGITDLNGDGKNNDGNLVYADSGEAETLGFSDKTTKQGYINLSTNATDTGALLVTDGHERGHDVTSDENFSGMVGGETISAWNTVNAIYGDKVNTSGNATQTSYNNTYNANNNQLLNQNTLNASLVAPENRDNISPITFASLALGVASAGQNIKEKKYGALIVDGVGIVIDLSSIVIPVNPGGAGMAISAIKNADKVSDAIKIVEHGDDASKGVGNAYRYITEGELKAIQETGLLRGGKSGETFFTKDLYKTSTKAQSRLSLPTEPTIRAEFKIINNPAIVRNGTKVVPANGMAGKGAEFMTNDPVQVKLINWQPIKK